MPRSPEYDYLLGPILMRISGTFTPTTAQTYGSALTGSTLYVPQPRGAATTTPAPQRQFNGVLTA